MSKKWDDSQKRTTERYKELTEIKKSRLVGLKAEEKKYIYLELHGRTPHERQAAREFLKGIREQIKKQHVAVQEQQEDNEKAYAAGIICRFW